MKNNEYNSIINDISIFSLAASDISAYEYLIKSGNYFGNINKFVSEISYKNLCDCIDVIYYKQKDKYNINECDLYNALSTKIDDTTKMNLLILGEDEKTISFINNIAMKEAKNIVFNKCNDKNFYEYFLEEYNQFLFDQDKSIMDNNKKLCQMVFSTMSDDLKNDYLFAKEIIHHADILIKKHDYDFLSKACPNILYYSNAILEFDDSIKKNRQFIKFALNHDHMSLYAESLCANDNDYKDVRQNFTINIENSIDEYSNRRLQNPEKVKSMMFKA